jgi:hypothetical protein
VRSHIGSIRPVRKLTDNWNEIQGLSYDLLFEALRLVLIFSLTIVQIGTAFTESVGRWFDKGMLRAPDLGYKEGRESFKNERRDFTGPANESTGPAKPTNVRKHHMSDFTSLTSDS